MLKKTLWFLFCFWCETKENLHGSAFVSGTKRNQRKMLWFRFCFRFVPESWFRKLIKFLFTFWKSWSTRVAQEKQPNRWSTFVEYTCVRTEILSKPKNYCKDTVILWEIWRLVNEKFLIADRESSSLQIFSQLCGLKSAFFTARKMHL